MARKTLVGWDPEAEPDWQLPSHLPPVEEGADPVPGEKKTEGAGGEREATRRSSVEAAVVEVFADDAVRRVSKSISESKFDAT